MTVTSFAFGLALVCVQGCTNSSSPSDEYDAGVSDGGQATDGHDGFADGDTDGGHGDGDAFDGGGKTDGDSDYTLPGGCWGDNGTPAGPPLLGSMADCAGNTSDLPACLFDAATYPQEQQGCVGVFDLDDIRDPDSPNLGLRILDISRYSTPNNFPVAGQGYVLDVRYHNGVWFGQQVTINAKLIVPVGLADSSHLKQGRGVYFPGALSNFKEIYTDAILFHYGVPVISPNSGDDQMGIGALDYETIMGIDPGIFQAVRDSDSLTDPDKDICFTGEPGDGCIASRPAGPHELRLCTTAIVAYTGNLHWSLRLLIGSNQLRSLTAAARAMMELETYDPASPSGAWSAFSGDTAVVAEARDALLAMGVGADTPFFSRAAMSGCSKNGSSLFPVAATDSRVEAFRPSCIIDFNPDTVRNELDVWPGGELGLDYHTGNPESYLEFLRTSDGEEMMAAGNLTSLAGIYESRGVAVMYTNMANDQLFPVNSMDLFYPEVVASHPNLNVSLNFNPNARHGAADHAGFMLLVDSWLTGRRMPQASACVRDLGSGVFDIEMHVDWKDYAFVAPNVKPQDVELWGTIDYDGYTDNDYLNCGLSPQDFRCSRYAAAPPSSLTPNTAVWHDIWRIPQLVGMPYIAFFPKLRAPIDGVVSFTISAPPQILSRPGETPFHAGEPGGYRLCQ
ncbi:MAG: hypothetical protein D6806_07875 [Deltaproteobacteria bacterium]|nr:MAG: hypothetical protein D6806_07875 [Deltaproteobacteria bacterium]